MARRGENIHKRKDGRWEGRYIKARTPDRRICWGYIYGTTYLNMTSHLEEHLDNFEFDIQLVKSLVQKIEVSADKRIRIVFGFRDVFTELGKESAET